MRMPVAPKGSVLIGGKLRYPPHSRALFFETEVDGYLITDNPATVREWAEWLVRLAAWMDEDKSHE